MELTLRGTPVVPGEARGLALVAEMPLSFWGGYDPQTGEIIDQRHPLAGEMVAGRVLVIPAGRGSCSGSGVLLEAIAYQTAPAAIIASRLDPIIGLGCVLGDELHQQSPPLILVSEADWAQIAMDDDVSIAANGTVTVRKPG
ncbi:MAG: DUF126 domain-containing protein [Thermomicrobiales bacterium]|nr:DUF126 domain-containing protein [Thermomicrobiales bacterium]